MVQLIPSPSPSPSPSLPQEPAALLPQSPAPTSEIPHPTSLLALSDSDESLLETYISLSFNLDRLSAHSNIPILRLIRWANLPHITDYLKVIDTLRLRQSIAEDQGDRRAAIDALKQILATSEDPIERRRAANAILRTLNAKKSIPRTAAEKEAEAFAHSRLGGQTSSRKTHSGLSTQNSALPRPRTTPSPTISAQSALFTVISALRNADDPEENCGLATLHAFCAKDATIDNQPVPEDLADFLDDLEEDTAERLNLSSCIPGSTAESTPTFARFRGYQFCGHNAFTIADILLRRESEDAPFLIASITFTQRNTS